MDSLVTILVLISKIEKKLNKARIALEPTEKLHAAED